MFEILLYVHLDRKKLLNFDSVDVKIENQNSPKILPKLLIFRTVVSFFPLRVNKFLLSNFDKK